MNKKKENNKPPNLPQNAEKENFPTIKENVDVVFNKITEIQKRITAKKIADMEESLERLEEELTEIINTHTRESL